MRCATCSLNPRRWSAGPTAPSRATGTALRRALPKLPPPANFSRGRALVDPVVAFHEAEVADHVDWQVEVAHPTPAGNLVLDAVVLLADGSSAFVEIDRTMSYARLVQAGALRRLLQRARDRARQHRPRSALPLAGDLRGTVPQSRLPAAAVRLRPRPAPPRAAPATGKQPSTSAPSTTAA